MKKIKHNKTCFACGLKKSPSFLGYDMRTMKTYCMRHCEKPEAIPDVKLVPATDEELMEAMYANYDEETATIFRNQAGGTVSARVDPVHIMHIMKVAAVAGTDAINQTLINIIENDMKHRNLDDVILMDVDPKELETEPKKKEVAVKEPEPQHAEETDDDEFEI